MNTAPQAGYMNVWQGSYGHQWTDTEHGPTSREICDDTATDVEAATHMGIRRIGILRVRVKPVFERGAAA